MGVRLSEASALSLAKRVSDSQAVLELMNNVFRHSECGPLRVETVLRSGRAQVGPFGGMLRGGVVVFVYLFVRFLFFIGVCWLIIFSTF